MTTGLITVNPNSPESYSVEVQEGEILEIGRKPAPTGKRKLVLPFPEVSGQHAEIRCKTNGWTVIDSGSTNGTSLNGARLTPGKEYPLRTGDVVQIAQYDLLVSPPNDTSYEEEEEDRNQQDKTQFRIHLINATILVGDIKGFTALSEQYADKPGVVMQAAQSFFETLKEEINRNYGQLEKIVGDAIMAYWHGDDSKTGASLQAFQACKTALQLKIISKDLAKNPELWPFKDHPMMLDMALATGPVAAGALGQTANPALLGDTANLVFRLEKLIGDDRPGDIVVENVTYELAKDHFKFEYVGQFSVKGRQRPVDVHRLLGLK
ncbi:MAG: adenylate/guanylate cyclase domain-containing protein [Cyanobacteria bacterium SZAS-4]|nr:adenylate/guanylate cyclase domain-containing protein [Cyanobacteria bacterium SZAS-4]